jgi:hypothetical protein
LKKGASEGIFVYASALYTLTIKFSRLVKYLMKTPNVTEVSAEI